MNLRRSLACAVLSASAATLVRAEVPERPEEWLDATASHVLVGTVKAVSGERDLEFLWDRRSWTHTLEVEEVVRGEGVAPGDAVEIHDWSCFWRLPVGSPAYSVGHRPLPLVGERCRVYATRRADGSFAAVLPNGWVLPDGAARDDPARRDPAPLRDRAAAMGWTVLAVGLVVTAVAIRRRSAARWVGIAFGAVLLLLGVWFTV